MKKTLLIFAMLFSLVMVAQKVENKPKLEKEGEMVKATYFHENGQIAQTGYYLNGKLHGEWKAFDENGKKTAMAKYENGKKTGKWFFWNDKILKEVNYQDNRITNVTTWNNASPVVVTE
ncbi:MULTISPECIES: toxin-antitoxin system YwqK family antitoxin [Galbibacter]|uniref:Nicotinic acid mononucleotide adenyltransferase n=1 Tax=Galbibacter pacificus TaxID=2996052 RepID=A0ABT6FU94_9FLAO|nr:nicotinic acid mononucleotide adenyltransferase [Galbibacter pacificus]MDG3583206.1 nicotinic acid mononucleotide adenyltransferase [Galbibacter pacificus]MDG3586687.1 nicotinic acid mononucleotide adenyltransferase [Galbibacter pacificus]